MTDLQFCFGRLACLSMLLMLSAQSVSAGPEFEIDLAQTDSLTGHFERIHGYTGTGNVGVPVTGGFDTNGDGHKDVAFAAMQAAPFGRTQAGELYLIFGDGSIDGTQDTGVAQNGIIRIAGDHNNENAGSEVWMDDVTGDGIGDLLICRQNYTPNGTRTGAGALTILVGGTELTTFAANQQYLDLRNPPGSLTLTTFWGASSFDRLCMWVRTGDVTGDGIHDILIGADQENSDDGAAYLIRGGAHLDANQTVDLFNFGTVLPGNIARVSPPGTANNFHFGATVQLADMDGNNRADVIVAATLARAGGGLPPPGQVSSDAGGGAPNGRVYIAWDNNFTGNWIPAPNFVITSGIGDSTVIRGRPTGVNANENFGEELLGGLDYDNSGAADLYVGDLTADAQSRNNAGLGHVIYDVASLKNMDVTMGSLPVGVTAIDFYGPVAGAIAGDTALHGDFDNDGIDDLAFSSPHGHPLGRQNGGIIHIFYGQNGAWPTPIDLRPINSPGLPDIRYVEIFGALGNGPGNNGDTLCYSAAAGDINNDGFTDLITNEMLGDGFGGTPVDVGNLVIISGRLAAGELLIDDFED